MITMVAGASGGLNEMATVAERYLAAVIQMKADPVQALLDLGFTHRQIELTFGSGRYEAAMHRHR